MEAGTTEIVLKASRSLELAGARQKDDMGRLHGHGHRF